MPSSTTDAYGNEVPDEAFVESACSLQQTRRREEDNMDEVSTSSFLLILPAGTAISTGDVVQVEGKFYEVTGEPWEAHNPRVGVTSHIEATVERTAGAEDAS